MKWNVNKANQNVWNEINNYWLKPFCWSRWINCCNCWPRMGSTWNACLASGRMTLNSVSIRLNWMVNSSRRYSSCSIICSIVSVCTFFRSRYLMAAFLFWSFFLNARSSLVCLHRRFRRRFTRLVSVAAALDWLVVEGGEGDSDDDDDVSMESQSNEQYPLLESIDSFRCGEQLVVVSELSVTTDWLSSKSMDDDDNGE